MAHHASARLETPLGFITYVSNQAREERLGAPRPEVEVPGALVVRHPWRPFLRLQRLEEACKRCALERLAPVIEEEMSWPWGTSRQLGSQDRAGVVDIHVHGQVCRVR